MEVVFSLLDPGLSFVGKSEEIYGSSFIDPASSSINSMFSGGSTSSSTASTCTIPGSWIY